MNANNIKTKIFRFLIVIYSPFYLIGNDKHLKFIDIN